MVLTSLKRLTVKLIEMHTLNELVLLHHAAIFSPVFFQVLLCVVESPRQTLYPPFITKRNHLSLTVFSCFLLLMHFYVRRNRDRGYGRLTKRETLRCYLRRKRWKGTSSCCRRSTIVGQRWRTECKRRTTMNMKKRGQEICCNCYWVIVG